MFVILSILAAIAMLAGIFLLSEATTGVGLIGLACLFGIFARIVQSQKQHEELMDMLEEQEEEAVSEATPT